MAIRFLAVGLWLWMAGSAIRPLLGDQFDVYLLGGQSNMEGFGKVAELPDAERSVVEGAFIYHATPHPDGHSVDGRGKWERVRPGHGTGFRFDGVENRTSDRFGVELALARRLRAIHPDRKIALIKYARNGSSIAIAAAGDWGCWDPDFAGGGGSGAGINQYDQCLATVRNAMSVHDIDGDGTEDVLIPRGIVWMQGESDARDEESARRYGDNLKRLMDLLRAALRYDDLPVAVGRISDSALRKDPAGAARVWPFGEIVRAEQARYCDNDPAAVLVTSPDNYNYSDPWHYDTVGYLDLGRQFADALASLECSP